MKAVDGTTTALRRRRTARASGARADARDLATREAGVRPRMYMDDVSILSFHPVELELGTLKQP